MKEMDEINSCYFLSPNLTMLIKTDVNGSMEPDGLQDYSSYLKKEEKIRSLLKTVKKPGSFQKCEILEQIKKNWVKTVEAVARRMGMQLRKQFETITTESGITAACDWFQGAFPYLPDFRMVPEKSSYHLDLLSRCAGCKVTTMVRVEAALEEGNEFYIPLFASLTPKYHKRNWRFSKGEFQWVTLADFSRLAAEFYLRNYVIEQINKIHELSSSLQEYLDHLVIGRLLLDYFGKGQYECFRKIEDNDLFLDELLADVPRWKQALYRLIFDFKNRKDIGFLLSDMHLQDILEELSLKYQREKAERQYARQMSGDHARSFETKKNIPQKYLKSMAKSRFNQYFGYVELDEDCDLELVPVLEKEYEALVHVVGLPVFEYVVIRFRKLGQHHASELYYPSIKCLCVDPRYPDSMAHGVGHMIDYELGHISEMTGFIEVYDRYEYLLRSFLQDTKDEALKKQLKGSGKFNLSYYLQPTEVFARCFELYLVRVRKVDNSLCEPESGFAYPEDEDLERKYTEYFDELFSRREKTDDQRTGNV